MTIWLIQEERLPEFLAFRAANLALDTSKIEAASVAERMAAERVLTKADGVATIAISGVLTEDFDILAWLFGEETTTYTAIREAIANAEADANIARVEFKINSPGGDVQGLFETVAAMQAMTKPRSTTTRLAASAAYALAANGGKIAAEGPASMVGSIGVLQRHVVASNVINVTSTEAPNKRPDPSTDEGRAVIVGFLDQVHELFAGAIAAGRGNTVEGVNANFGRGSTLLATEALSRGMVDSVATALRLVGPAKAQEEQITMKWIDYKAAHPAEAAEAERLATEAEQKRVQAHLTMGEACGDMKIALDAIKACTPFGDVVCQAAYMAASLKSRDIANAGADAAAANTILSGAGAKPDASAPDLGDQIAELCGAPTLKA